MDLVFKKPSLEYVVDGIMLFQTDNTAEFWSESLFAFFSQIDKDSFKLLDKKAKRDCLFEIMGAVWDENAVIIDEKLSAYNAHWLSNKSQIEAAFSDAFGIDCGGILNDMTGFITLNPIEPRWLADNCFDVFYLNSHRGALGVALHEITHFVWFYVWQKYFKDDASEYETPHLKWVFSEMVVDVIMRGDERLSELNPYFKDGCAYSYFYTTIVEGELIMTTLFDMYKRLGIKDFMEQGYAYCVRYEKEIRTQMA